MVDYREILRLSAQGYSLRQLASTARSSHHTVKSVLELASLHNIAWPLEDDVTNIELMKILYPDRMQVSGFTPPDFPYIHRELARSGVTLTLLWNEYCTSCHAAKTTPYMYTQFCEKYRRWARVTRLPCALLTNPEKPCK